MKVLYYIGTLHLKLRLMVKYEGIFQLKRFQTKPLAFYEFSFLKIFYSIKEAAMLETSSGGYVQFQQREIASWIRSLEICCKWCAVLSHCLL